MVSLKKGNQMKKIISLFIILLISKLAFASSFINIYQNENNTILLVANEQKARIIGYGSAAPTSADCIFSTLVEKKGILYSGYLESLDLEVFSYDIDEDEKKNYPVSFNIIPKQLLMKNIDMTDFCGIGVNFHKKYNVIINSKLFNRAFNEFLSLLSPE